jgi:membrane protein implicated in regulation of membrane protease activity
LLLKKLTKGADLRPTNVAALLVLTGTLATELGDAGGLVKLSNGETWTARLDESAATQNLAAGTKVTVTAIEGSTAVVAPSERNSAE